MACVSSFNFLVLVNESPIKFFKSQRGCFQGCPLYSLLFLLIMEGLIIFIDRAKRERRLKCDKISTAHNINHLLFVDGVLLFGDGSLEEWEVYNDIIKIFCEAYGMKVNV